MSARLVCDRLVVSELPVVLDPYVLANALTRLRWCSEAKFTSSICVRYTPNVPSNTPGQAILACSVKKLTDFSEANAAACKVIFPVWKSASLVIPKDMLKFETWSRGDAPTLWLSGIDIKGIVDITCTVQCAVHYQFSPIPPPPTTADIVSTINTKCYVGPVLAGFSLVCCMPRYEGTSWNGVGQSINMDLKRGTGLTTGNKWIRTPERLDYVAVRYGFGSDFSYSYNASNGNYAWKSYTHVIWKYQEQDAVTGAAGVSYYGSWRPIKGSTSWWAELNPTTNTTYQNSYPCAQLILYYEFPGVDIFDANFVPSFRVHPGTCIPDPPGEAISNANQRLPLNTSRLQSLWNPAWLPVLDDAAAVRFTDAREALTSWPTTCNVEHFPGGARDISECDEGHGKSDDACIHREDGPQPTDRSP